MSAKKIRDEIMKMTIVVNSNPAQQEIFKLTNKNRELKKGLQELNEERKKEYRQNGRSSAKYKALTKQINDTKDAISSTTNKIKELEGGLKLSDMSVKQLRQELRILNQELGRTQAGSQAYNALQQRIKEVRNRLYGVEDGAVKSSISFGQLANKFNHYSGIVAATTGVFLGFALSVKSVIDRNNKLDDAMSGVMKKANMTKEEVKGLMNMYKDIDTRTKKIDLLKISEVGGSLNVAKEELLDFTREVDKAYVSLGDSWKGSLEDLANSLGKIAKLYSETKNLPIGQAINEIGSALNELAAQGTSTEQNISEFVKRMGSVPEALRPGLNTLLGFGAALEENGINAEIGASGLSKFLRTAAKDADKFARVMGVPVEKVKEMINQDPSEFFLKFSKGLRGLDPTQLAKVLDSLKLNDNEVIKVVGAASANTDRFRESVALANKAVAEGTSLQDEFNKVNNNAAGIYDKIQKKIAGIFTSQALAEFLNDSITMFGKFIGVVEDSDGVITGFREGLLFLIKILTIATATMLSYNLSVKVTKISMKGLKQQLIGYTIVQKASIANKRLMILTMRLWAGAVGISQLAVGKLTRSTKLMTLAQKNLNRATRLNPLGALVATVIALGSALYFLYKHHQKARKAAKEHYKELHRFESVQSEVMEKGKIANEKFRTSVDKLIGVLNSEIATKEMREKAYNALIKIHPEFMNTVDSEFRATARLAKVYETLAQKIELSARAKARASAKQSIYDEIEKNRINLVKGEIEFNKEQEERSKIRNKYKSHYDLDDKDEVRKLEMMVDRFGGDEETKKRAKIEEKIRKDEILLDKLDNHNKERAKELEKLINDAKGNKKKMLEYEYEMLLTNGEGYQNNVVNEPTSSYTPINNGGRKSRTTNNHQKRQYQRKIDETKRHYKQSLALEVSLANELEEKKIELMKKGMDRELAELELQRKRKLQSIESKRVTQQEFKELDTKIASAKGDDKILFVHLKESWLRNNEKLNQIKKKTIRKFNQKTLLIKGKHLTDQINIDQKIHQRKLSNLKRSQNEELALLTSLEKMKAKLSDYYFEDEVSKVETWQQGKALLNKQYQQEELQLLYEHLNQMAKQYEGLDMSILTEEQKEVINERLEEVRDKMAEVAAKKNEIANGGNEDEENGDSTLSNIGGNTDILGMSPEQWDELFSNLENGTNLLDTLRAGVQILMETFSTYYAFVKANEQAQLKEVDKNAKQKEKRLKRMLNSGQLNQKQYEEAIQHLNEETDRRKEQLEMQSAKRQRNIQIAQIVANTAQAIMSIWAQVPKFDFGATAGILTGVVSALGALQIATVMKTPLPTASGYEDGFGLEYDINREQDGKQFRVVRKPLQSGLVNRPTHFIAGENGVEMVIDNPTYTRFRPEVKRVLHEEIAYAKGYEKGYYPNFGSEEKEENFYNQVLEKVVENNTKAMESIIQKKFRAYLVKDMDTAKDILEVTEEYKELEESAKR